jgi:Trypsin-like peptidase domain/Effector-associated domain 1
VTLLHDIPYPWQSPAAQQLHETLISLYPSSQAAMLMAKRSQVDTTWIFEQQAAAPLWKDILEAAATAGRLRALVRDAHDRLSSDNPARPFLGEILADRSPPTSAQLRDANGAPLFVHDDDSISEPEALLFRDDLTVPVGQLPGLIATLGKLVELAPGVCKLTVNVGGHEQYGTGFRIGADLLLTNWHVLHRPGDGATATAVSAEFGFEDDGQGRLLAPRPVRCDAAGAAGDQADDWAVVRALDPLDPAWPVIALSEAAQPVLEEPAFIIQHPQGQRKRVGFVRNQVSYVDDRVVQYLTDTDAGSSGSPVLDARGALIALHHQGGRPRLLLGKPPLRKNEGIRISRVIQGLDPHGLPVA